ncbi:type II toxin-antitoxin system RelE/ParE family toxin [Phragmitibacter flavus]|uniref:Type II toxin-antitoxin system RelE/ParE family toxin n=1 Tax=Phragmitibacter flavus TaxID=2576071 RepID=A0A5R8KGM9_9BACT|nr:type II toxin-antitoxin system RelE/ParE family toxin [Phragmitibacter flavus]TLD71464.1 type II toxin-antitoxin system RelE/ParE family toxin [Phragmitibacter flavus]
MSKTYEVILSAEAERNIEEAVAWIAEANPTAGEEWYVGLIAKLGSLSQMPLRCPVAPESKLGLVEREIRQLLYGRHFWKYRVLFSVDKQRVLIAHVRHGARLYLGQREEDIDDGESS